MQICLRIRDSVMEIHSTGTTRLCICNWRSIALGKSLSLLVFGYYGKSDGLTPRCWRTEGVGVRNSVRRVLTPFLFPFSCTPLFRRGTQFWGTHFCSLDLSVPQPTPFCEPLIQLVVFRKNREQKRHIRKNRINFLKTSWMAGCPWDTRPVSRQKCPFLSVFL